MRASVKINKVALFVDNIDSAAPLGEILFMEVSPDVLFVHFFDIFRGDVKEAIGLVGQTSFNQPIVTLADVLQVNPIVIPFAELCNFPESNSRDGM